MKLSITAVFTLAITTASFADTWTVDDDGKADFDNIQAAVDAASDGDEIIVMPGTYTGSGDHVVNMNGKEVLLRSQDCKQVNAYRCTLIRTAAASAVWCTV